jgi:hypothetical protein
MLLLHTNIDDEDPDAVIQDPEEPVEEAVESWSTHMNLIVQRSESALRDMAEKYQAAMAG